MNGNNGEKGDIGSIKGTTGDKGDRGEGFSYNGFRQCASSWTKFDGHCYLVASNPTTSLDYNSARATCQSFSSQVTGFPVDIVSIDYQNEFNFINNLITTANTGLNTFVRLKINI